MARVLRTHMVSIAVSQGLDQLNNRVVLRAAEEAEFDVLFTTDNRIRYQQNLKGRQIALVVLTVRRTAVDPVGHRTNLPPTSPLILFLRR